MKIKNTRELILRARHHARHDHVRQGTYGEAHTNGTVREYQGCAVGCLATPHRKRDLLSFIKSRFRKSMFDHGTWHSPGPETLNRWIGEEFGIPKELMSWAEAEFEARLYHSEAIEFIPAFAEAVATREGERLDGWRVSVAESRGEDILSWLSRGRFSMEERVQGAA